METKKKEIDFPTRQEAINYVLSGVYAIANLSERWRDDKEVVLAAVRQYGYALEFASDRLKADTDVVIAAITKTPRSLMYAAKKLRDDRMMRQYAYYKAKCAFIVDPVAWKVFERLDEAMIRSTTSCNPETGEIEFLNKYKDSYVYNNFNKIYWGTASLEEMMDMEKELIVRDLSSISEVIEFVSTPEGVSKFMYLRNEWKSNKAVVLKAIESDGRILKYASRELQADYEVVSKAIEKNPYSLLYAARILQDNVALREKAYRIAKGAFVVYNDVRKRLINNTQRKQNIIIVSEENKTRFEKEKDLALALKEMPTSKRYNRYIYGELSAEDMIEMEKSFFMARVMINDEAPAKKNEKHSNSENENL